MNFKKMTFLCMQKLTNFPYIEADFDALTNYELLCKVVEYLNKIIANENAQNEALNVLATAFNNLKTYVDNYFENLDVQEEINNKLDEMAESGELTDIIAQYLGLAGMIAYDTVADMKLAENLVNGSKCRTLGFHSVNDGGGAYYKVRTITNDDVVNEMDIIALHDNTLIAELIIENELNVKQIGAYGNGTNDDTNALNTAFLIGYLKYKPIYIPDGSYNILNTLIIYGASSSSGRGNRIYGDTIASPKFINTNESLTNMIEIKSYNNEEYATNVYLSNIDLYGENNADNGIKIYNVCTSSVFENITIRECTENGLTKDTSNPVYLDTFRKIRCFNCGYGINLSTGNNTSLRIVDCYMMGCTNAYKLSASYSTVINCCADHITNYVFHTNYFTGSLIDCATESPEALQVFRLEHTTATLVQPWAYGNPTNASAVQIVLGADSHVVVEGGSLLLGSANVTSYPGKLYSIGASSSLELNNVFYNKYDTKDTVNSTRPLTTNNSFGQLNVRNSSQVAYIGRDTLSTGGKISDKNDNDSTVANAIYFGLGNSVQYLSDGTNMQYAQKIVKGDILLSRNPETIGGIGWIQAEDVTGTSGATWNSGTFLKIPVIMSGSTANRPTTNRTAGQMYLDTTLIKPIWWTGSRWVDATGTEV